MNSTAPGSNLWLHLTATLSVILYAVVVEPWFGWDFLSWACNDVGASMTLVHLLREGHNPNIDFAYTYGPLSVLTFFGWAEVFGNAWLGFFCFYFLCQLTTGILFIAIVKRMGLTPFQQVVAGIGLFWFLGKSFHGPTHAFERTLLMAVIWALTLSRPVAAATLAGAAFSVRSSSASLVAAVAVVLLLIRAYQLGRTWPAALRKCALWLAPLVFLQIVVFASYASLFGVASYARTVLPVAGARMYQFMPRSIVADHAAAFRPEWDGNLLRFAAEPGPLLLVCLVFTLIGAIPPMPHRLESAFEHPLSPAWAAWQISWVCAILLVADSFVTYGGGTGYYYHRIFFWLGACAGLARCRNAWPRAAACMAASMAVLVALPSASWLWNSSITCRDYLTHRTGQPVPGSVLLLSTKDADVFKAIAEKTGDRRVAVLCEMGDPSMLRSIGINAAPHSYWCLQRGLNTEEEEESIVSDCLQGDFVIVMGDSRNHLIRKLGERVAARSRLVMSYEDIKVFVPEGRSQTSLFE